MMPRRRPQAPNRADAGPEGRGGAGGGLSRKLRGPLQVFKYVTVRVKGCVDRQTLSAVLDHLAPRGVIALPAGTRIWLAAGVADMRRGMYALAELVETVLLENV